MAANSSEKVTVRTFKNMRAANRSITALTAYDFQFARLVDEAGVDMILVGDSLGMTMLGYETTIPVTLADMLRHTAAVVRGVRRAMVIADMPFLTYHVSPEQALINAGRFLQEAGAGGVKLEGGRAIAGTIGKLTGAGIPVLGHIGILPQSVLKEGGYRVHGRSAEEAEALLADARAVADAGAFAIVLEGLPASLAARITAELTIPTIGIGAGPDCDGQIQVMHDLLGLCQEFIPKHAKRYAHLADTVKEAVSAYRRDVTDGLFPAEENTFI
ncbi:MAG: 3-methyl-2-oxobutanoate hydroxymethyltransferase [Lentisphaeria bacterium]|nr:3-methyl-2-oxobutanoate hydroxymethyltransferase [Lentisphaeria bacterium]